MKVIITFNVCCDNLSKSQVYDSGKASRTQGIFLLLCGHPVTESNKLYVNGLPCEKRPHKLRIWQLPQFLLLTKSQKHHLSRKLVGLILQPSSGRMSVEQMESLPTLESSQNHIAGQ